MIACGKSPETASSGDAAKPAAPTAEKKESAARHPWGSFKVGSYVAGKTTTAMEVAGRKMNTVIETKTTLVDLSADKATIETEMTAAGKTTKTKTEVPLTAGTPGTPTATPAANAPALKTGTESITIAGKSLNCKWTEMETEVNGAKTVTKTWMSEDVPGGVVKMVSTASGAMKSETTMEVVDFKAN